jgi:hypothetical protein
MSRQCREGQATMVERLMARPARSVMVLAMAVSAVATALLAATTRDASHWLWGVLATVAYLGAFASAACGYPRAALRVAALGGALLPAVVLVTAGIGQPEIGVVERSARVLLHTGSPYLAAPAGPDDVNPYLPLMAAFGLPRQLFGDSVLGDPRPWFLAVFLPALAASSHFSRTTTVGPDDNSFGALLRRPGMLVWAVLGCPIIALPAAVGGHDLPVVALLCLGLVLAVRARAVPAGLVLGLAAALKQSAWPAAAVAIALLTVVAGTGAAWRCALVACTVVALAVVPVIVVPTAASAVGQLAGFPLGAGGIASPATTPTPGVLLARAGPVARLVGLGVLGATVLTLAVWLLRCPPRSLAGAATLGASAETLAALVLPTSRAGYLVYPVVLLLFAWTAGREPPDKPPRGGGAGP